MSSYIASQTFSLCQKFLVNVQFWVSIKASKEEEFVVDYDDDILVVDILASMFKIA